MSALTVIVTVSEDVLVPSLTCNSKVMSLFDKPSGAVTLGVAELGSSSVTLGPPVWTQV